MILFLYTGTSALIIIFPPSKGNRNIVCTTKLPTRQGGSAKILDLPDRGAPNVLCLSTPPKQRNAPEEKYPQKVDLAQMAFFTTNLLFILNQTISVKIFLQVFSVLCTM